jgi:hypothetical protein
MYPILNIHCMYGGIFFTATHARFAKQESTIVDLEGQLNHDLFGDIGFQMGSLKKSNVDRLVRMRKR